MERFSQREGFEEFREEHKRNVDELFTGRAFNSSKSNGYELKLSLNVLVNDDQFGIHFANGRYDLREKKFAARLDLFTSGTKWINYDFTTDETTESLMQTVHGTLSKIFLEPEPDALELITFELAKSIFCAPVDN
jgi:hypothetical protein